MIVISKSDLLSDVEKYRQKIGFRGFAVDVWHWNKFDGSNNNGYFRQKLENDQGELEGELIIGPTQGNIHIPILYSLFCVVSNRIEESIGKLNSAQQSYASAKMQ